MRQEDFMRQLLFLSQLTHNVITVCQWLSSKEEENDIIPRRFATLANGLANHLNNSSIWI